MHAHAQAILDTCALLRKLTRTLIYTRTFASMLMHTYLHVHAHSDTRSYSCIHTHTLKCKFTLSLARMHTHALTHALTRTNAQAHILRLTLKLAHNRTKFHVQNHAHENAHSRVLSSDHALSQSMTRTRKTCTHPEIRRVQVPSDQHQQKRLFGSDHCVSKCSEQHRREVVAGRHRQDQQRQCEGEVLCKTCRSDMQATLSPRFFLKRHA